MRWPSFNWFWFIVGFVSGIAATLAARLVRQTIDHWKAQWARRHELRAENRLKIARRRWRYLWLRRLQHLHVAAPLFPLEDIVLEPRVLPWPSLVPPDESPLVSQVHQEWPFSPDTPVLASAYGTPTLTLPQALAQGASVLLVGPAGSGKTVALAWLALRMLQAKPNDPQLGDLAGLWPWWVHVDALALPPPEEDPLAPVWQALSQGLPQAEAALLVERWQRDARKGKAVLLVDGLDEVPPARRPRVVAFLEQVHQVYPNLRLVVAAAPDAWGPLTELGLVPLGLQVWDEARAAAFARRWLAAWRTQVAPRLEGREPLPEDVLLRWFMAAPVGVQTPLYWTWRLWQLCAGDAAGHDWAALAAGYVRRMAALAQGDPAALEAAWADLAYQRLWPLGRAEEAPEGARDEQEALRVGSQTGLLRQHRPGAFGFVQPVAQAYLAAQVLAHGQGEWPRGPWWHLLTWTLGFWALHGQGSAAAQPLLRDGRAPLLPGLWEAARAVALAPRVGWGKVVYQALAKWVQAPGWPWAQRLRAVAALVEAHPPRLGTFFRGLLKHADPTVRAAAIVGLGLLKDAVAMPLLQEMLAREDLQPIERRMLFLALARYDTRKVSEALAAWLLEDDDEARREVAEALALAPVWGHEVLREAATYEDDLLVRRAAVYGLAHVPEPWARELLAQLREEDPEWLVSNAAGQVLDALQEPSPLAPVPPRPLHEEAWLLAFAARQGLSIAVGPPAQETLRRALAEGNADEKRRALRALVHLPDARWLPDIGALLGQGDLLVENDALSTLWCFYWSGVSLPLTLG